MESFSATTQLYKDTLRLVELSTLSESNTLDHSNTEFLVNRSGRMRNITPVTPSQPSPPMTRSINNSPIQSLLQQQVLSGKSPRSSRLVLGLSVSPTHSSPLSFFSVDQTHDGSDEVCQGVVTVTTTTTTTSPFMWDSNSGHNFSSPSTSLSTSSAVFQPPALLPRSPTSPRQSNTSQPSMSAGEELCDGTTVLLTAKPVSRVDQRQHLSRQRK